MFCCEYSNYAQSRLFLDSSDLEDDKNSINRNTQGVETESSSSRFLLRRFEKVPALAAVSSMDGSEATVLDVSVASAFNLNDLLLTAV